MFVHQSAIIKFGQSTALASRENPATLDRNPQTAEREAENGALCRIRLDIAFLPTAVRAEPVGRQSQCK